MRRDTSPACSCLILPFSGVPVAGGLPIGSAGFLLIFDGACSPQGLPQLFCGDLNSIALLSIPIFIIAGSIAGSAIASTRAGFDLYEALQRRLIGLSGGARRANFGACALFVGLSRSSPATCASIGKMGIPRMRKRGHPDETAAGFTTAGGRVRILIPPSVR